MPISIAGSGTITGISVGGIPDGVVDTDVLAANAVTTAKLGSAEASGLAKAWVNFNGTGTVAIRASYNVSSITDNGTGDYTVNFTTAMVDTNYCLTGTLGSSDAASNNVATMNPKVTGGFLAGSCRFYSTNTSTTAVDRDLVSVAIFR
jgi:hypothetical protein